MKLTISTCAQMLIANQRLDDAEKVLHALEKTSNQQLAFSVQNSLNTVQMMRQHPVHVSSTSRHQVSSEGDEDVTVNR